MNRKPEKNIADIMDRNLNKKLADFNNFGRNIFDTTDTTQ